MTQMRGVRPGDRSELSALWSLRFDDSPSFIDWFFQERFSPRHSFCIEDADRIVSVIHGWPMRLHLRDVPLPALMLCGVATRPGYERRGHMHALMRETLQFARENGFPLLFHKPNRLESYASLEQLPCTETLYHRVSGDRSAVAFSDKWDADELLAVYRAATARYSGYVERDSAAMRLKLRDYRADGARLVRCPGGYAVLFEQEAGLFGEEVLAVDKSAYRKLLQRLPMGALLKLPPDLPFSGEIRPQNVIAAADIGALLSALCGNPDIAFAVSDPAVPQNNGVFDGSGAASSSAPSLRLSAGELVQRLCGYQGDAVFEKRVCFCVDEY